MNLKILTLNCNKGYSPEVWEFLGRTFAEGRYDFILLQEIRERESPPFDALMTDILDGYQLLRTFNKDMNMWSELTMAYRENFTLEESRFFSFPPFKKINRLLPEFGFLLGTFDTPEGRVRIGSVHCQSALQPLTRGHEARIIKQVLLDDKNADLPVIFGGDMNSGLPGEKSRNRKIFGPEFKNITNDAGPTVDSRYVEPGVFLTKLAVLAANLFGFRLRMTVDHIYADRKTAEEHSVAPHILPDRVSDHSPVEVVLTPKAPTTSA